MNERKIMTYPIEGLPENLEPGWYHISLVRFDDNFNPIFKFEGYSNEYENRE